MIPLFLLLLSQIYIQPVLGVVNYFYVYPGSHEDLMNILMESGKMRGIEGFYEVKGEQEEPSVIDDYAVFLQQLQLLQDQAEERVSEETNLGAEKEEVVESSCAAGWELDDQLPQGSNVGETTAEPVECAKRNDDLVMFFNSPVDAAVVVPDFHAERAFKELAADVVFAAYTKRDQQAAEAEDVSLNTGAFIGRLEALLKSVPLLLEQLDEGESHDSAIRKLYKLCSQTELICLLDSQFQIFQPMEEGYELDMQVAILTDEVDGETFEFKLLENHVTETRPSAMLNFNRTSPLIRYYLKHYLQIGYDQEVEKTEGAAIFNKVGLLHKLKLFVFLDGPVPFIEDFFWHLLTTHLGENQTLITVYSAFESQDAEVEKIVQEIKMDSVTAHFIPYKVSCLTYKRCDADSIRTGALDTALLSLDPINDTVVFINSSYHVHGVKTFRSLAEANIDIISPWMGRKLYPIPPKSHINVPNRPPKYVRRVRDPDSSEEPEEDEEFDELDLSGEWEPIPGYFDQLPDYDPTEFLGILKGGYRGGALQIRGSVFRDVVAAFKECDADKHEFQNWDLKFKYCVERKGLDIYTNTYQDFGYRVTSDGFDPTDPYSELKLLDVSPMSWRRKYVREEYDNLLQMEMNEFDQPCPEVFQLPVFNDRFCHDIIGVSERSQLWGPGGYAPSVEVNRSGHVYTETHPTVDIQFEQMGMFENWMQAVHFVLFPIFSIIYPQFNFDVTVREPGQAFIARYHPNEQAFLGLHHDASTYSLNMALNRRGVDFEGGGTHFKRQNCSVLTAGPGDVLVHPGQLTHLHSGLNTTRGTRYILVSFMQP